MPRKTGKNVAKKGRSRSTIRNQKVSRSSRRNSGRNSVVKRKKKSRRKQRGRGDDINFVSDRTECSNGAKCISQDGNNYKIGNCFENSGTSWGTHTWWECRNKKTYVPEPESNHPNKNK